MATSSSAKKVARVAARSGGGSSANRQANWLFPMAIGLIVVLGIGVVVYARSENGGGSGNTIAPRARLSEGEAFDHWHASFAVNVCGTELPPPTDAGQDVLGIHTHGDGLVHIHPFASRAAGENATMKRFFDQIGLEITDDAFRLPEAAEPIDGGQRVQEGETECGGEPGELVLAHWDDARTAASSPPDEIFRDDFSEVRFTENYGAYTLAYVAEGTEDIPPPDSSAEIVELGARDGGTTGGEAPEPGAVPTDPSGSIPVDPAASDPAAAEPAATDPAASDTPGTTAAAGG
jgi:hypothetical protein